MGSPLQLRPVLEPAAAPGVARSHPMIDAGIASLPPVGSPFSAAQRDAWFELMRHAFTLAYGAGDGVSRAAQQTRGPAKGAAARPAPRRKRPAPPKPLGSSGPRVFVDRDGFARRAGGERILASEVDDDLVDLRGMSGDIAAIVWADDSVGIPKGVSLNVTVG